MAPRVFISYTHDTQGHMDRAWDLSERLRRDGVDCRIDQQEESPAEGWPRWCKHQIRDADFVFVICTGSYLKRYEGEEEAGKGLGGQWEGYVITQEVYESKGKNTKFIPLVVSANESRYIPVELRGATSYDLSDSTNYDKLFRRVTAQPQRRPSAVASRVRQLPLPTVQRTALLWKQVFTVPFPQNPFFTGREAVLEELKKTLDKSGVAALTGLGGTGKTQTAAQYAYHHRKDYQTVLWVRAASQGTRFADLTQLAGRLELSEREAKEQSVVVDAVKSWLDKHESWLLVLDNVEDFKAVGDLAQKAGAKTHHVVITTQLPGLGLIGRLELSPLDGEQGALLLLRRAKLLPANAPLSATAGAAALAREISEEVSGLPLALDQAGAYIKETGCRLDDYLALLRERFKELMDRRGGLDSDHLFVAGTFLISMARLAKQNPAAGKLLLATAFMAPDAIPEEILTEGAAEVGPSLQAAAGDPLQWREVIGAALRYSLLEHNPAQRLLAVHRMVQTVTKSRMNAEDRAKWAERVVRAVNAAFPKVEFAVWNKCERLAPNAQMSAALVDEHRLSFPEAARLLNQAGHYLEERARYAEAEPLMRRALAIDERGPDQVAIARDLNSLASLLENTNRLGEAEVLMRRALLIVEKAYGADHPNVAASLNNLAALLMVTNRTGEAEPLLRLALAIEEKTLGLDHPNVASCLAKLAALLQATNRMGEAEELTRRALAMDVRSYGPGHPNVAIRLNNLAHLLQATDRLREAEPLMWRALAIDEHAYGPDHPAVARDLNNLGQLLEAMGRLAEAEDLMRRVVQVLEKAHRVDHPTVATSLNNLAELLKATNRLAEAEPLYRRALAIDEYSYGPDHPNVAIDLNNLAQLLKAMNRLAEAESLMRRAVEIEEKSLGPDHPNTVLFRKHLVGLLRRLGRFDEATKL